MTYKIARILILLFALGCSHIPSGQYIRLKKNETLETISKDYGISQSQLMNLNRGAKFKAGHWVFIPVKAGINQMFRPIFLKNNFSAQALYHGKFLWPVPTSLRISSKFGQRRGRPHMGIDIPAKKGSSIVAVEDGLVTYSGNRLRGYGNLTVVAHKKGFFSVYAHASKNFTKSGQRVYRGQVIAKVGTTGRTSGPHLHFEVRRGKMAINPIPFIRQSRKVLTAQSK